MGQQYEHCLSTHMDVNSISDILSHVPEWLTSLEQLVNEWAPKATAMANQIQSMDPKVLFFMLSILGIVICIVKKVVKIAALFGGIAVLLMVAKYFNVVIPLPT